jgi:DNA replication and repair protein RecF
LFVGQNAQGKTNILEAIYVLALGKSHRTRQHKELIQFEQDWSTLSCTVQKHGQAVGLKVLLNEKGKKMTINGIEQSRISEYIGAFPVVMFSPEDLRIVKGSPQIRRRFIDTEIGQVSRTYVYNLSQYNKLLLQRNTLLKQLAKKREYESDLLEVLTLQLAEVASKIWKKRFEFVKAFVTWAKEIHENITRGKEEHLNIKYIPSAPVEVAMNLPQMQDLFVSELKKIRHKEVGRGSTLVGPHRDDLVFYLRNSPVASFGSQGQQRTVALALKLASLELIKHEMGTYPVLLLDDVLSELDDMRKTQLLDTIYERVQTFVTATSLEGIDKRILEKAHIFEVYHGTIRKL